MSVLSCSFSFLLLTSLVTATAQADQTCRSNIEKSTPVSRFVFNDNGTVTDKETQITWMRCALGQKWNGKTCTGKAREFSWEEARDAVSDLNSDSFGEPGSWRLPYVPELASIVERQCFKPRVNLTVFPATPSKYFWTGMEQKGSTEQAYAIDFNKGAVKPSRKSHTGPVRLMLDGPNGRWWKKPATKINDQT